MTAAKVNRDISGVFAVMLTAAPKRAPAAAAEEPPVDGPYMSAATVGRISDRKRFFRADSPLLRPNFHRAIEDELKRIGTGEELETKTLRALLRQFAKDHRLRETWLYMHLTDASNPLLLARGEFSERARNEQSHPSYSLALLSVNPHYDLTADKAILESSTEAQQ